MPFTDDYASKQNDFLKTFISHFEEKSNEVNKIVEKYGSGKGALLEIQCYSIENFPNGDNRSLDLLPANITLMELLLQVEHKYMKSPITLYYVINKDEQINIDSDLVLSRAIDKATQDNSFNSKGEVILQLVVVCPLSKNLRSYISSDNKNPKLFEGGMIDLFQAKTDLSRKESLLDDLNKKTNLSKNELEKIYQSFMKVTTQRFENKTDGTVDLDEFLRIMGPFIPEKDTIIEFFNSIDVEKSGRIDFRDFVCAFSILKGESTEDKLRLAFNAYDFDHNGFIDKNEMAQLVRISGSSKGFKLSDQEVINAVEKIFQTVDQNGDGNLSYTEFKEAVLNSHILLNTFWSDKKLVQSISTNNNPFNSGGSIFNNQGKNLFASKSNNW